jgi:DNA-binding MarR family transcriptional regulator
VKTQARGVKARHEILALIRVRSEHGTTPPTIREIAAAIGLSTATVHRHVGILIASGLLERTPGLARTLRPVQPLREDASSG